MKQAINHNTNMIKEIQKLNKNRKKIVEYIYPQFLALKSSPTKYHR